MANKNRWDSFFLNASNVSEDFFSDQIGSSEGESAIKISVDPINSEGFPKEFVDKNKLNATTEAQIRLQEKEDDYQAKSDALNKNA
jgi:hypothetical protein